MSQRTRPRRYSREFKENAARRMVAGDSPTVLAKQLGVLRKDLYAWKKAYKSGQSLVNRRGPKPVNHADRVEGSALKRARQRIAELERKVGQQTLELDFFAKALRCVDQVEASNKTVRSTNSSERKRRKAN